jgi:hypothetical protein
MGVAATVKRNLGKFLPKSLRKRYGMSRKRGHRRGRR